MEKNMRRNSPVLRFIVSSFLFSGLAVTVCVPPSSAQEKSDEAAIQDLQTRQADAWNQHDAKAYASLFTDDGDVVNIVGWWWRDRAEIERKLTAAFTFVFLQSTLTISKTDVRFLTPQIAVAHVQWTMAGAKTPPGVPEPKQGIEIQVLEKKHGKWLIKSFQNTTSVPEQPFPLGPPFAPSAGAPKP